MRGRPRTDIRYVCPLCLSSYSSAIRKLGSLCGDAGKVGWTREWIIKSQDIAAYRDGNYTCPGRLIQEGKYTEWRRFVGVGDFTTIVVAVPRRYIQ